MSDFRVYVSNIPWSTTEHDLALLFDEKMGPCVSLVTIGRGKNGMARGFAFVSFVNQQFCDRALSESGKIVLDGRILRVSPLHERAAQPPRNNGRAAPYEPIQPQGVPAQRREVRVPDADYFFEAPPPVHGRYVRAPPLQSRDAYIEPHALQFVADYLPAQTADFQSPAPVYYRNLEYQAPLPPPLPHPSLSGYYVSAEEYAQIHPPMAQPVFFAPQRPVPVQRPYVNNGGPMVQRRGPPHRIGSDFRPTIAPQSAAAAAAPIEQRRPSGPSVAPHTPPPTKASVAKEDKNVRKRLGPRKSVTFDTDSFDRETGEFKFDT